MKVTFSESAFQEYMSWQTEDKKTILRINELIKSIQRDGFINGIGKPEALMHEYSGWWSRRIDEQNRIVYKVESNQVVIVQCGGHYDE